MADIRTHLNAGDLAAFTRDAYGPDRTVVDVDRLRGGSKKGVYRLTPDDGATCVAYVWSASENYWPDAAGSTTADPTDPFRPADGIDLFLDAHRLLNRAGVRVPAI